jgi:kynurenine formamidase
MKRTYRMFLGYLIGVIGLSFASGAPSVAAAQQPAPPWPAGDERGMANAIGPATWGRCAAVLSQSNAKPYEISHLRSGTMPLSPFAGPYAPKPLPTGGLPGSSQVFNMDVLNADANPGQQGTQMDAIGHFGYLEGPWDETSPLPVDSARYYGGFTQKDVKPTPESPLLRLGIDKAPPIVTTAVLLDAKRHVGRGQSMKAGEVVTAQHLAAMLEAQGLQKRGILPGDAVFVYTGWGDLWKDPDTDKVYYSMAPGLSYDAVKWLGEKRIVVVALDTPFVDAMAEGQLAGKAGPAPGTPPGFAFAAHHHLLAQMGIHLIENAKLDEIARDRVWTSCTMILPLREKGGAGSPVRPVAIGVPGS